MFNSTYVRGGDSHTNIDINSVSGTLVKNYQKSFFFKCKENSVEAERLFNPTNSCIYVSRDTKGAIEGSEYRSNATYTIYYKKTVVLQTMILANGILLNEVIWQDDFDDIFKRELNSNIDLLNAYKRKMMDALDDVDEEVGHINCDGVLCDLLNELGFGEIVEIYERQEKWYS